MVSLIFQGYFQRLPVSQGFRYQEQKFSLSRFTEILFQMKFYKDKEETARSG